MCQAKNKINFFFYTCGAPHHATSAPGVCQMGSGVFLKESSNFRDRILTKIFTGGKTGTRPNYRGVKTY